MPRQKYSAPYTEEKQISYVDLPFNTIRTVEFTPVARAGFTYWLGAIRLFVQQVSGAGAAWNYKITTATQTLAIGQIDATGAAAPNSVPLDLSNPIPIHSTITVALQALTAPPWSDLFTISVLGTLEEN